MSIPQLSPLDSVESAKQWVGELVYLIGLGFHPDTEAREYVHARTGSALFDDRTAAQLEAGRLAAFDLLGDDFYTAAEYFAWRLRHGLERTNHPNDLRVKLIRFCIEVDGNGTWSDQACFSEGIDPLTVELALAQIAQWHAREQVGV